MISNCYQDISGTRGLFRYENSSRFEQNLQNFDKKRQQDEDGGRRIT